MDKVIAWVKVIPAEVNPFLETIHDYRNFTLDEELIDYGDEQLIAAAKDIAENQLPLQDIEVFEIKGNHVICDAGIFAAIWWDKPDNTVIHELN